MEFIQANWVYILVGIGLLTFFGFGFNQVRLMLKEQRQTLRKYKAKRIV